MANLLDQASIVLTPTAYDNGKVLCAKPSEPPYGDFDFSRNSAATRVNAQGLVENVQILSSNLVQNGDFSEEGVQEVSNGSFSQEGAEQADDSVISNAGGSVMTKVSALNYNATSDGTGGSIVRPRLLFNNITIGKSYRIRINPTNQSGTIDFKLYDGSQYIITGNDLTTDIDLYFKAEATNVFIAFDGSEVFNVDFEISLKEVGQDWTLGTGWSIAENKANGDGSGTAYSIALQSTPISALSGNTIRLEYTISNYVSGIIRPTLGVVNGLERNSNGTFIEYIKLGSNAPSLQLVNRATALNGSITNISVKEVGQNWELNTGWEIGNNLVTTDGTINSRFYQDAVTTIGQTYKYSFDVLNSGGGVIDCRFRNGGGIIQNFSSEGTYTGTFVAYNTLADFTTLSGNTASFSITNISVIEITTDTSLPRINYEGFSYQDALGSEEIVNGDFSSPTTIGWSDNYLCPFIVENNMLKATAQETGSGMSYKINGLTIGTKYVISWDYINGSGALPKWRITNSDQSALKTYSDNSNYYYFTPTATTANFSPLYQCGTAGTFYFDNVSVKEYLGQEPIPNSGCGHWLWEPQSTNLITQSELFSDSSWLTGESTITSNYATSPSGNNDASRWLSNSGASNSVITAGPTVLDNTTYTISFYVKSNGNNKDVFRLIISSGGASLTSNDLTATSKWQRFTYSGTRLTIGTRFGVIFPSDNSEVDLQIWGAQVEQQSYATSYIPTSGSSVTRNQDLCTNGGSLASINSTEGVLYAEIAALANENVQRILSVSDGTHNNTVKLGFANNTTDYRFFVDIRVGGVNQAFLTYNFGAVAPTFKKCAIKYKENDFALWIDGVEVATDTSGNTPIGLNELSFTRGDTAQNFFGKTKALAVWKEALSDEELTLLTAPAPVAPTFTLDFDEIANQFTFNRASFATRVNEQGLIETVSNIGSEEIVNGDFATDSYWNKGGGATISGGKANIIGDGSAFTNISQGGVFTSGKKYKVEVDVTINSGLGLKFQDGANNENIGFATTSGTYTFNFTATSNSTITIGRRTGGTPFNSSINNVSVKEVIEDDIPRIDYSTGAEAFLLEPQSTNLVPYSEDFTVWNQIQNVNLILNSTISPSGENNATKFLSTTGNSKVRNNFSVVSGTTYTFSVYCKNIDATFVRLLAYDGANEFSLNVVSQINTSTWTKVSLTFTATNTSGSGQVQIARDLPDGESLYFWGAQLEEKSYSTSYIPTSGTSVTRVGETCVNATPEINSEEGVLYAEISALANDGTNRVISLNSGQRSNSVRLYFDNSGLGEITMQVRSGNVLQVIEKYVLSNLLDFNKIAIKYKKNDFALWVNGIEVDTDTSGITPIGLDTLSFNDGSLDNFFGNTKDIQVFTEALSDYQLAQLTTI